MSSAARSAAPALNSIFWWRHYWQNDSVLDYRGTRLKLTQPGDHYLVTSDVSRNVNGQAPWQTSLLKINRVSGAPVFWHRYNIARFGLNRALLSYNAGPGSAEWYLFGGATNSPFSAMTDSRLIGTNTAGITCGARSYGVFMGVLADTFTLTPGGIR